MVYQTEDSTANSLAHVHSPDCSFLCPTASQRKPVASETQVRVPQLAIKFKPHPAAKHEAKPIALLSTFKGGDNTVTQTRSTSEDHGS